MHLFFIFDFTFYFNFITMQTGSMKLGRDVLVLTQTSSSRSVALLSQCYNENKEVSYFDCSSVIVMVSSLFQLFICVFCRSLRFQSSHIQNKGAIWKLIYVSSQKNVQPPT